MKAVQQIEFEKQRKLREALIVMEAARRHRAHPPLPATQQAPLPAAEARLAKHFKAGVDEPVDERAGRTDSEPKGGGEPEEDDDVEDVPIAARARRRESLISDIDAFESDVKKFAGITGAAVPEEVEVGAIQLAAHF